MKQKLRQKVQKVLQWLLKHRQEIIRGGIIAITLIAVVEHTIRAGRCTDSVFIFDTLLRGLEAMLNGTSPCP